MISLNLTGPIVQKAAGQDLVTRIPSDWSSGGLGWWSVVRESFSGAWQRNVVVDREMALRYGTVWSCITLIAADISKLWVNLVEHDGEISTPTTNTAYSPVLRKPNHYQTRVKFFESWALSRLTTGNTYILKERNHRGGKHQGTVDALHVLDPSRVTVLVSTEGTVFYKLAADNLAGIEEAVTVPATEIIHDICVPMFHPLVGVSPIFACGMAAMQGLRIQQNSAKLFENGSQLSGVLTAPASISDAVAKRLQDHWETNFSGQANAGKVAVLGDGLKFEPMTMTAVDAQLIDQLQWTGQDICACFHVPGYMVGIGAAPPYTDIQSINLQYYAQALQQPVENMEILLEEGLEVPANLGVEFDIDALIRMDGKTQMEIAKTGVAGGIFSPNEGRARFNKKPKPGGDSVYLQQQMYSLEALAARDAAGPAPHAPPAGSQTPPAPPEAREVKAREAAGLSVEEMEIVAHACAIEQLRTAA